MSYIFHVRNWNIDFFLHLEKLIETSNPSSNIIFLTMEKSCFKTLLILRKIAYYLPDVFEKETYNNESDFTSSLDDFMYKTYGYGIEFIYEMERFKPELYLKNSFVKGHINALFKLFPANSKMIALSMDHFVYIISAYINEQKGGVNYFIQPIGFPQNAQVILRNPFDINYFREEPLEKCVLNEYIKSLSLNPMDSIHYMIKNKNIHLIKSILIRIKAILGEKPKRNIFTYLDTSNNNLLPSRWFEKRKINFKFNYYSVDIIRKINNKVFYLPLQYEPEMSILAYSPWYKNQLEVIRLICQSLRVGDILLIKENPKMIGKRDSDFYRNISNFNNVRWADPKMNSRDIIRSCYKVISISGTATIEAACLGINSLIFGFPPFRKLLIQKPLAEYPLADFANQLYITYDKNEIINHLNTEWPAFSKSIIFGNFIPRYNDYSFTLYNSDFLAKSTYESIIK